MKIERNQYRSFQCSPCPKSEEDGYVLPRDETVEWINVEPMLCPYLGNKLAMVTVIHEWPHHFKRQQSLEVFFDNVEEIRAMANYLLELAKWFEEKD